MGATARSDAEGMSRRAFVRRLVLFSVACAVVPDTLSACTSRQEGGTSTSPLDSSRWKNSDLAGSVTDDTPADLRGDFHVAVNHDWLAEDQLGDSAVLADAFTERRTQVGETIVGALSGAASDALYERLANQDDARSVSRAARLDLARRFYAACADDVARDAAGAGPIRPLVSAIEAVQTLDQLSDLLCFASDLAVDPFVTLRVGPGWRNRSRNEVFVAPGTFSLGDPAQYQDSTAQGSRAKSADDSFLANALVMVGYTRAAAEKTVSDAYDLERALAQFCASDEVRSQVSFPDDTYQETTVAQLADASTRFPLARMLEALGIPESAPVVIEQPDWLSRVNALYVVDNLSLFKALLLANTLRRYSVCLDEGMLELVSTWQNAREGTQGGVDREANAYQVCETFLPDLMGSIYRMVAYDESLGADVRTLAEDVRSTMLGLVDNADRLSSDARTGAHAKVASLAVRVGGPSVEPDVSDLAFDSSGGGSNLVNWCVAARHHAWHALAEALHSDVADASWRLWPQRVEVSYVREENTLFIPAGIVGGTFFGDGVSPSAERGALGVLVARAFVQAIDRTGSRYDSSGFPQTWWTSDDDDAYDKAFRKVADYLSSQTVLAFRAEDGGKVAAEEICDIGALQCVEALEATRESDHATLLESFARLWRRQMTEGRADVMLSTQDVPFGFLRSDVGVQQSSYFYEAFSVVEGEAMYLSPENRITLW